MLQAAEHRPMLAPVGGHEQVPTDAGVLDLLEALYAIRSPDLEGALNEAAGGVAAALGADLGVVFVYRPEVTSLVAAGASDTAMGRRLRALGLDRLPLVNGGRAVQSFRTGTPHASGRADRDPDELRGLVHGLGIRSVATAAIGGAGARHGVLMLASAEPDAFDEQDLRALGVVAGCVGLRLDRAQLVAQLAAAVERPDHVDAEDQLGRLTGRQREVAALIGEGLTNAQIARRLGLTEGTVANHMEQALRRLGLRNRAHLAVWACRYGLARPDSDGDGIGPPPAVGAPGQGA